MHLKEIMNELCAVDFRDLGSFSHAFKEQIE